MKDESITDADLREFLLGKVADEEQERIESLFLTDSHTRERVLAIEQELIEDYLENSLTEEDKGRFLLRYAQTDEQRRNLKITRSIKDWATAESKGPQVAAATFSFWSRLRTRLRLKPFFLVPIAVTILIAIVLAIVWLNSQSEQRKHLAVEQELAQLNSPTSLRDFPQDMISYELRPVTVRSVEPQIEFKPRADIRLVELRLPLVQQERYFTYQAEVRRIGDDKSFKISNLQTVDDIIRVRLPAHFLNRGHYQIHLSGIAKEGSASHAAEYSFAVGS